MGGNLNSKIWGLPPKRIDRSEYDNLSSSLLHIFKPYDPRIPKSLPDKETFGDIDFCINSNLVDKDLMKFIERICKYKPHKNGDVISFPLSGVQIDLNLTPDPDSWINYSDYQDTSNIIGRLFHKLNLHLGHFGLSYWLREDYFTEVKQDSHILEKIILTKNWPAIISLVGLNVEKWEKGFNSLPEIYQWVSESAYFNPSLFAMENQNHINRTRDRKRPQYRGFLEWIEAQKVQGRKFSDYKFESKSHYLERWIKKYLHLSERIEVNRIEWEEKENIKSKINGHLVMEWMGWSIIPGDKVTNANRGKAIQKAIEKLKQNKGLQWILESSPEEVKEEFFLQD